MDRAARARVELDRVRIEARAIQEAGPPCRDCRYISLTGRCSNPAYYRQIFEPSSGSYSVENGATVEAARANEGLCGPEALLWEPQGRIRSLANSLGRQMDAHPFLTLAAFASLLLLF